MTRSARLIVAALAAMLAAALPVPTHAQTAKTAAAFDLESDDPVHIEADVLEVFDETGTAVFSGNVLVRQDTTVMQTTKLTVFYEGGAVKSQTEGGAAPAGPDPGRGIKRLVAEGKVVVTAEDQEATGDKAVFEMATNTVTLTGQVVLSQGGNVLRGTELVVDLDTGRSTLLAKARGGGGRVTGLFNPGSAPPGQQQAQ